MYVIHIIPNDTTETTAPPGGWRPLRSTATRDRSMSDTYYPQCAINLLIISIIIIIIISCTVCMMIIILMFIVLDSAGKALTNRWPHCSPPDMLPDVLGKATCRVRNPDNNKNNNSNNHHHHYYCHYY